MRAEVTYDAEDIERIVLDAHTFPAPPGKKWAAVMDSLYRTVKVMLVDDEEAKAETKGAEA